MIDRGQAHTGGKFSYLTIFNGDFEQRLKAKTDLSVERTTSKGKVLIVEQFPTFTGQIESIDFDLKNEYGPQMKIVVQGASEKVQIQLKLDSGYGTDLLMRIGNVNLSKPVELNPVFIEEDGKKKSFFAMKQDGFKIERKYNRDTAEMPEWEVIVNDLTGEKTYKKGKQVKWLMDRCAELEFSALPMSESPQASTPPPAIAPAPVEASGSEEDDDLPF